MTEFSRPKVFRKYADSFIQDVRLPWFGGKGRITQRDFRKDTFKEKHASTKRWDVFPKLPGRTRTTTSWPLRGEPLARSLGILTKSEVGGGSGERPPLGIYIPISTSFFGA